MALFVDTSALVKAYIPEPRGSDVMTEILSRPEFDAGIFVSDTVILETYACFARKLRDRQIDEARFQLARDELRRDLDGPFGVVEHHPDLVDRAVLLVDRYRARGVGGIDYLHLANAEKLATILPPRQKPVVFVAVDHNLTQLAASLAFITFDPETEPVRYLLSIIQPDLGL